MKLEIREIDGVPVTGSPGRARTVNEICFLPIALHVAVWLSSAADS